MYLAWYCWIQISSLTFQVNFSGTLYMINAMFTRIRTFLKTHIFYPDSCGRDLKPLWRAVSKQCGFRVRIHWFRVNRRPIRVKKYTVAKISGFVLAWPKSAHSTGQYAFWIAWVSSVPCEQRLLFRCVSWLAKSSLCRQPIVWSVVKWREFGGNKKKKCYHSDLLCKNHATL